MGRKKAFPTVHVKKIHNGTFTYFFEGTPINGKRHQVMVGGFKTSDEAKIEGNKALLQHYGHLPKEEKDKYISTITVKDFICTEWFPKQSKLKNWLPETKKSYLKNIELHILPKVGNLPISAVRTEQLQEILDDLYYEKKFSHASVSNIHSLIYAIFRYAKEHHYTEVFYSDEFVVPKTDEETEETVKQVRDIIPAEVIDKIFERFPEGSSAFLPMAIALYTGARLGEACALTTEACDFKNNIIHIVRQMPDGTKNVVSNPKYNSQRDVPMCPTLKKLLQNAIKRREENEKVWRFNYQHTYLTKSKGTKDYRNLHGFYDITYDKGDEEVHFINVTEYGKPIFPEVMKYASRIIHGYSSSKKVKEKSANPIYADYNTHSFRHTFISLLKKQNLDDVTLSSLAGHKKTITKGSSKTTSKYIHSTAEQKVSAIDLIENIYTLKADVLIEKE